MSKLKEWLKLIFSYPKLGVHDFSYDVYWQARGLNSKTSLNSFQKKRANLTLQYLEKNSLVLDVGCGNGALLSYINNIKPMKKLIGIDVSEKALAFAKDNNIETINGDISKFDTLKNLPSADYILMFEVIEHFPNSEDLIRWAVINAKKGVFFSVPNTGFFVHRLRLLFGKFPLQWRVNPSEHLRFWTVKDIRWWLRELGLNSYNLKLYEGIPLLNKIWPSLFGQGIWVFIPTV
ncbi:MAG: class I SAM-dependent methyltransferase [Patescibacteria group bacterium]